MKAKTIALLAGAGGSLLITQVSEAEFIGLSVDLIVPDQTGWVTPVAGLTVVRLYADFSGSSPDDHMIAVAGTPATPLNVEAVGGTFYQTAVGNDNAPNAAFFGVFPSLEYDTFVSIGTLTSSGDATNLSPGWPGFGASLLSGTNISWFITPDDPQGDPHGNHVLLGQFSLINAVDLHFQAFLLYNAGGVNQQAPVDFHLVPTPGALALFGMAGLLGRGRRRSRRLPVNA